MSTEANTPSKALWNHTLAGWLLLWVVIAAVLAVILPGFPAAIAGALIYMPLSCRFHAMPRRKCRKCCT